MDGFEWVEAAFASTAEERFPRLPLLNGKMIRVEFNKGIVIFSQAIHRNKTFARVRNMKNIAKMNITIWGLQGTMTNM